MANQEFIRVLKERGWEIFRGGNQIVFSKGDYRITLKPSLDVPGKVLMIKGLLNEKPRYEFFDSKDYAFRDVERFIRQESKPTQPQIGQSYSTLKRGVSYEELLEEAINQSPDVSQLRGGRQELENIVNYVYMTYPGAHNISWDGYTLRFEGSGVVPTVQMRSLLELEGVL